MALPVSALAQDIDDETIEEIVVTGTGVERTGFETPQSVVQYSEEQLRAFSSSSQADILTQLAGVSAEGGGGEVATNVFHRALPSGGQFSFTPLNYDGMPSFSTFGLNSSAFDVYYRNDLGIERSEFVSGGVSNLFGPGSVAGIINYISKTGGPENEGTLQVEAAEEGRMRADYFFSGPLGDDDSDTFYALSGYYRDDEGPLDSGLDSQGFQLRGNLKREFEDGSGSVTVYGQAIDDKVQFFLPLPVDGNSRERVDGNDGDEVYTMNTVEAIGLSYDTPDGRFTTPIADGVVTKGTSDRRGSRQGPERRLDAQRQSALCRLRPPVQPVPRRRRDRAQYARKRRLNTWPTVASIRRSPQVRSLTTCKAARARGARICSSVTGPWIAGAMRPTSRRNSA